MWSYYFSKEKIKEQELLQSITNDLQMSVMSVADTQDSEVNTLRKNKDKGDTEDSSRKSN